MNETELPEIARPDGALLRLRRVGKPGAPRLILSHGNGFAIDGYRAFWSLLADAFELILFDLRNHGRNPRGPIESHTIAAMAGDHAAVIAAVGRSLEPRPTAGVFHSVSSIAAVLAARDHGARWDALALVDPPMVAPEGHPSRDGSADLDVFLASGARGRTARFADPTVLAAQFRARLGRAWTEGAEFDMARAVTRPTSEGDYELCCPGEYEAQIYLQNSKADPFAALPHLKQPTFLVGADPTLERALPPARVGPVVAAQFGLPHAAVPGTSHMLQIEKPRETADLLLEMLRGAGFPA